jgi:hypothetical protein
LPVKLQEFQLFGTNIGKSLCDTRLDNLFCCVYGLKDTPFCGTIDLISIRLRGSKSCLNHESACEKLVTLVREILTYEGDFGISIMVSHI